MAHVLITYDGRAKPQGGSLYVNGLTGRGQGRARQLSGRSAPTIRPASAPARQQAVPADLGDLRSDDRDSARARSSSWSCPAPAYEAAGASSRQAHGAQAEPVRHLRRHDRRAEGQQAGREVARSRASGALEATIPTTMVMQEMPKPRDTFMLMRGQYDKQGEKVTPRRPGEPAAAARRSRRRTGLALARWLVAPEHPLTARVTVNRFWQMFFGTGIVKTAEDFGSQGEQPSHPELLDWLAVRVRDQRLGRRRRCRG